MAIKALLVLLFLVVAAAAAWLVWDAFSEAEAPALEPEAAAPPPVEASAPPARDVPPVRAKRRPAERRAPEVAPAPERRDAPIAFPGAEPLEEVDTTALQLVSLFDGTPIAEREAAINGERVVTDANGRASVPSARRYRIVTPGFVEVTAIPSHGWIRSGRIVRSTSTAGPLVIGLFPSAGITGVVQSAAGRPLKWLELHFKATTSPHQRRPGVYLDTQRHREVRTDDFGRFRAADLPAGPAIEATVGTLANTKYRIPGRIELEPGEMREVRWVLPAMGAVIGVVQDQFGQAVSGASVWLYGKSGALENTRTGKKGQFRFDWLALGRYRIEVEPVRGARASFAPAIVPVHLTSVQFEVVKRITVNRGLFISGFVVGPGGEYLPGIAVMSGRSTGDYFGNQGAETETGPDGSFRLGPLRAGRHEITAHGSDGLADSPVVEVEAGTMGLMLRLPRAARIEGKVIDAETLSTHHAEVRAYRRSVWAWYTVFSDESDGGFQFEDLEPGVYDLKAVTEEGRVACCGGLVVKEGARLENVELRLAPGGKVCACIEGFAARAGEIKRRYKWSVRRGGAVFHSEVVTGASTEIPVPAETVEVRLVKLVGEVLAGRQTVAVPAGERRELRFHP